MFPSILLSTLVFLIVDCSCSSHDWDLLIFTQHWPPTVCQEWKEKQSGHTCKLMKTNSWTVHGVWPTKLGTIGPQFCNNSIKFDPQALEPLEKDLQMFWPNVFNGTSEYSLWKHEWRKHGTCAVTLDSLNTEVKYFSVGLNWLKEYAMDKIISRDGINPDIRGYSLQQLWDAVRVNLGNDPDIQCVYDKEIQLWYLQEIRICFNKTLNLIDCDGIKKHIGNNQSIISNCPTDKRIVYPPVKFGEYTPRPPNPAFGKLMINLLKLVQWIQWMTL